MTEKKQLNEQELEKISGGFHNVSDPLVGQTIKLSYRGAFNAIKKIDAHVLEAIELDNYQSGNRKYKLNVNNGYVVGYFNSNYVTGNGVFFSKDDIKTSCWSKEELIRFENTNPDYYYG